MQLTRTFFPDSAIFIEKKWVENQLWGKSREKNVSWRPRAYKDDSDWESLAPGRLDQVRCPWSPGGRPFNQAGPGSWVDQSYLGSDSKPDVPGSIGAARAPVRRAGRPLVLFYIRYALRPACAVSLSPGP